LAIFNDRIKQKRFQQYVLTSAHCAVVAGKDTQKILHISCITQKIRLPTQKSARAALPQQVRQQAKISFCI